MKEKKQYTTYRIWRRHDGIEWLQTSHTLKAQSDKDAESRMKRMFSGCGFHSMSLVAVSVGDNPNTWGRQTRNGLLTPSVTDGCRGGHLLCALPD